MLKTCLQDPFSNQKIGTFILVELSDDTNDTFGELWLFSWLNLHVVGIKMLQVRIEFTSKWSVNLARSPLHQVWCLYLVNSIELGNSILRLIIPNLIPWWLLETLIWFSLTQNDSSVTSRDLTSLSTHCSKFAPNYWNSKENILMTSFQNCNVINLFPFWRLY